MAKAVATGSTNWTETGLCTQTNNVIIIEDEALAAHYLEYWRRLKADTQPAGIPASGKNGKGMVDGFAPNLGRPGAELRADNAEPRHR